MADNVSDFTKDYNKIKDDISTLRNDVSGLLKLIEKEGFDHVKDQVKSKLNDVKDSVKGSCDLHKVEECVKNNPKESIFFAVAAGMVLACLLGRK